MMLVSASLSLWLFLTACFLRSSSAQEQLQDLVTEYSEWRYTDNPFLASSMGRYEFNGLWENYTLSAYTEAQAMIAEFSSRLEAIDREALGASDQLNYDILKSTLDYKTAGFPWLNYTFGNPVNFLEGVSVNELQYVLVGNGSRESYWKLLDRLKGYPNNIDQQITAMRMAIASGLTNYNTSITRALTNLNEILQVTDPTNNALYQPLADFPNDTDSTIGERQRFLDTLADTIRANIMPKIVELEQFVRTEYLPSARASEGVGAFPQGAEFYQACAKYHTTTDKTPDEIHQLGLDEVERISGQMQKIVEGRGFNGTVREFVNFLSQDRSLYKTTSEELVQYYRNVVMEIDAKLGEAFHTSIYPRAPLVVRELPYDGPGGIYNPPAKEGEPGTFFLNAHRPESSPLYNARSLVLHEASPGHHFQIAIQLEDTSLPEFRKFLTGKYYIVPSEYPLFTGYIEGWALYAEYVGEEMGVYTGDLELFGRYASEIFRACRLVVDTGIHVKGWSRQRAIDYMLTYTSDSPESTATEIDRYITWPGQALAYKVGELKIKELRQKATEALGDRFNVKDFHSKILRLGSAPLDVLERVIDSWIDEVSAQSSTATGFSSSFIVLAAAISLWVYRTL